MRAWPVVLLMLLPGCLAPTTPAVARLGLFGLEAVERDDPVPVAFSDCDTLRATLNERALTQARIALEQAARGHGRLMYGDVVDAMAATTSEGVALRAHTDASAAGAQVTGTNNQEQEADEADILKTDGEWTYVLIGGALRILHSENVGDVTAHAAVPLNAGENHYYYGGTLLLERRDPSDPTDDRLVVVTRSYSGEPEVMDVMRSSHGGRYGGMTRVLVFSLADRSAPAIEKEIFVEGENVGARLIDGVVHVVVNRYEAPLGLKTWVYPDEAQLLVRGLTPHAFEHLPPDERRRVLEDLALEADRENQETLATVTLSDHLPAVLEQTETRLDVMPRTEESCRRVWTVPESTGRSVSTILSLDVRSEVVRSSSTQVLGGRPLVYASGQALVLAAPSQDTWWFWAQPELEEATDLLWFDLQGLDVVPRASGRVAGTVQDSFGIDVSGDELRVATTTGRWGRWWVTDQEQQEPMMNHLAVFGSEAGKLVLRGMVGGIAPGERIWSARFTDERAYLVTFRQIDPLWIIDLKSVPPRILGELEIEGVSTYIHPIDDETLLTIGYAGAEGGGLKWDHPQLSLFDISDPARPRRADVLALNPEGMHSWSGATHEHKAFTYWPAIGMLAVPVSSHNYSGAEDWWASSHLGLKLIKVDVAGRDLSLRGEVDQDHLLASERRWGGDIQRSYFLGYPDTGPVSVYSLSELGLAAHDLATLEPQDAVAFPAAGYY